jgi:hypothetical protein
MKLLTSNPLPFPAMSGCVQECRMRDQNYGCCLRYEIHDDTRKEHTNLKVESCRNSQVGNQLIFDGLRFYFIEKDDFSSLEDHVWLAYFHVIPYILYFSNLETEYVLFGITLATFNRNVSSTLNELNYFTSSLCKPDVKVLWKLK